MFRIVAVLVVFTVSAFGACSGNKPLDGADENSVQGSGVHVVCNDSSANLRDESLNTVYLAVLRGDRVTPLGETRKSNSGTLYQKVQVMASGRQGFIADSLLCPEQSRSGDNLEAQFMQAGLVKLAGGIEVDLKYASEDNFLRQNVYGSLRSCYLHKVAALKLNSAQIILKRALGRDATLVVYDCARPVSVQKQMWAIIPNPSFVANPNGTGSRHNYGLSVDLTFRDAQGRIVDMGTPFDDFTARSSWNATGLTLEQNANRDRLRMTMTEAGFHPIPSEWWHYDAEPNPASTYSRLNF
jgi:D-alanyl-D-alanine dipeptidase